MHDMQQKELLQTGQLRLAIASAAAQSRAPAHAAAAAAILLWQQLRQAAASCPWPCHLQQAGIHDLIS